MVVSSKIVRIEVHITLGIPLIRHHLLHNLTRFYHSTSITQILFSSEAKAQKSRKYERCNHSQPPYALSFRPHRCKSDSRISCSPQQLLSHPTRRHIQSMGCYCKWTHETNTWRGKYAAKLPTPEVTLTRIQTDLPLHWQKLDWRMWLRCAASLDVPE